LESSRLKAGLGTVRVAVAFEAAVAWACIGAFAETLRLVVVWVVAAVFVLLYGERAARRDEDERFRRARGRHWSAWRAECDCSMAVRM
jgi:phage gp37-like protein